MPAPGGLNYGLDAIVAGLPAEFAPDAITTGNQDGRVTGTAGSHIHRDGTSGNAPRCVDYLPH